ncbi:MAG: DUF3533 domain-containing protein [Actinobacteria bacterium]|nr:DUF3533 domain-containing protein [Actinomycetota bacterium]
MTDASGPGVGRPGTRRRGSWSSRLRRQLELGRGRSPVGIAGALLFAVLLVQLAMIGSYVGALHSPTPREVPIALTGPAGVARVVETSIRARSGNALKFERVGNLAAAIEAIDQRRVYAALIAEPRSDRLLVAGAASALIAEELPREVRRAEPPGRTLRVRDVKPLPASDSRGISPFYLVVGWLVGGYLGATILGLARGSAARSRKLAATRVLALAAYAGLSGILGTLLVQDVIGTLEGSTIALMGVGTLIVFATGAATAALQSLFGVAGTALAIVLFVAIGNPSSGGPLASQLLTHGFWADVGPLLPPGAGTTLVRNVVYFGGNAIGGALLVLTAYAALGAALTIAVGGRRGRAGGGEVELGAGLGGAA